MARLVFFKHLASCFLSGIIGMLWRNQKCVNFRQNEQHSSKDGVLAHLALFVSLKSDKRLRNSTASK
jgi:hypothetical protein